MFFCLLRHARGLPSRAGGRRVNAALAKLNVGNRVDIVWTEAALVSIEPGK
jgi:hypothetical protein